jgi:hypothetical protein
VDEGDRLKRSSLRAKPSPRTPPTLVSVNSEDSVAKNIRDVSCPFVAQFFSAPSPVFVANFLKKVHFLLNFFK